MKKLNELTAPAKVKRAPKERDVQTKSVAWARARGYWARKFSSMSQRSVPDYLFSRCAQDGVPFDIKFACEFKRPGKEPTEAQWDEIRAMQDAGWQVFYCDDFGVFKEYVLKLEQEGEL
jgi:hypothetical protein